MLLRDWLVALVIGWLLTITSWLLNSICAWWGDLVRSFSMNIIAMCCAVSIVLIVLLVRNLLRVSYIFASCELLDNCRYVVHMKFQHHHVILLVSSTLFAFINLIDDSIATY